MKLYLITTKIIDPDVTSDVEFHNKYDIIIIPLTTEDQMIVIGGIIEGKFSKHKEYFTEMFR